MTSSRVTPLCQSEKKRQTEATQSPRGKFGVTEGFPKGAQTSTKTLLRPNLAPKRRFFNSFNIWEIMMRRSRFGGLSWERIIEPKRFPEEVSRDFK